MLLPRGQGGQSVGRGLGCFNFLACYDIFEIFFNIQCLCLCQIEEIFESDVLTSDFLDLVDHCGDLWIMPLTNKLVRRRHPTQLRLYLDKFLSLWVLLAQVLLKCLQTRAAMLAHRFVEESKCV